MKLTCYQINDGAPRIVAARSTRAWMDHTRMRYAYRCLPLTIANSMGWELLCPTPVTVEWNGGPELADVRIEGGDEPAIARFAQTHFGHGILTLQTSYLFRTEPGVGLSVRGAPNLPKDGIVPLDAIVETDWLDFSFTMNWMFTRPARVRFEKDEPFCFITPIEYRALDGLVPEIRPLAANSDEFDRYKRYAEMRNDFNAKLAQGDQPTVDQGWQKWYMRGQSPLGGKANPLHLSRLRLPEPQIAPDAEPVEPGEPDAESDKSEGAR